MNFLSKQYSRNFKNLQHGSKKCKRLLIEMHYYSTFKNINAIAIIAPGAVTSMFNCVPSIIWKEKQITLIAPKQIELQKQSSSIFLFLRKGSYKISKEKKILKEKYRTCPTLRFWSSVSWLEFDNFSWKKPIGTRKVIQISWVRSYRYLEFSPIVQLKQCQLREV